MKVGSVHARVHYRTCETAFTDKMDAEKKASKLQVNSDSRADILELKPKSWNNSTQASVGNTIKRTKVLSAHDPTLEKFNYRTEVLSKRTTPFIAKSGRQEFDRSKLYPNVNEEDKVVPISKRIQEMEVHPSLRDKTLWNHSIEVIRKHDQEKVRFFIGTSL